MTDQTDKSALADDPVAWTLFDHFPKQYGQDDGSSVVCCSCGKDFRGADWKDARSQWSVHARSGMIFTRASTPSQSTEAVRKAALREAAERIQAIIDTYSMAGANLLMWLTEDDDAEMPRTHRQFFNLFPRRPSEREWVEWGNDVACRAAFSALREARDILALIPKETPDAAE